MTRLLRQLPSTVRSTGPVLAVVVALLVGIVVVGGVAARRDDANLRPLSDATGQFQTYSITGSIDTANPFFQRLGSNGRACATCHILSDGWTISPANVRAGFLASDGLGPLFRVGDAATTPVADVATARARQVAYRLFITRGLIRVDLPVPPSADFILTQVDDPYGYASSAHLSLFRRPLPIANLRFSRAIMWDGRMTREPLGATGEAQGLQASLDRQAVDAVSVHLQPANPLTEAELQQIVAFETALFAAQVADNAAGPLDQDGGRGGVLTLLRPPASASGAFDLYAAWAGPSLANPASPRVARESVARGEAIFNTRAFLVTGVAGLNDALSQPVVKATCATCHDLPNAGSGRAFPLVNVGTAEAGRRPPDLPLYVLRCVGGALAGRTFQTTDPGRALVTGACQDVGKFQVPVLRNLTVRAPYFHDGSAATLRDVVDYFEARFNIGITPHEEDDLIAFLRSL